MLSNLERKWWCEKLEWLKISKVKTNPIRKHWVNTIFVPATPASNSVISFGKWKANSTIEQLKCEGHEKLNRLQVSKVEFNFLISQRNRNLTDWSSFL